MALADQARLELAEAVALRVVVEVPAVAHPGPAVDQQVPEADRLERVVELPELAVERLELAEELPVRAVPVVLEEPVVLEVRDLLLVVPPMPAPMGDAVRVGPATPTGRRAHMRGSATEPA